MLIEFYGFSEFFTTKVHSQVQSTKYGRSSNCQLGGAFETLDFKNTHQNFIDYSQRWYSRDIGVESRLENICCVYFFVYFICSSP